MLICRWIVANRSTRRNSINKFFCGFHHKHSNTQQEMIKDLDRDKRLFCMRWKWSPFEMYPNMVTLLTSTSLTKKNHNNSELINSKCVEIFPNSNSSGVYIRTICGCTLHATPIKRVSPVVSIFSSIFPYYRIGKLVWASATQTMTL